MKHLIQFAGKSAAATCLLMRTCVIASAAEAFVIDRYGVDIEVMENHVYHISEHLDVQFEQPRHGLIRSLPLRFDKAWVKVSEVEVEHTEYFTEQWGDLMNIKIGSADREVTGRVSYTIHYTYDVGADRLPEMDEFNHNVIGLNWDTRINKVQFRIRMPKAFDASRLNCTSGPLGSTLNNNVRWEVSGNLITGETLNPLWAHEGLTVALPLPQGYWIGAVHHRRPQALIFKLFAYPLYSAVFLLTLFIWTTKGRDRKLFPSVEFRAPEGMTPAEIGYIIDGSIEAKDVSSLILHWAEQGHLTLEETADPKSSGGKGKKLTLNKVSDLGPSAKSFELFVFKKLFEMGHDGVVTTDALENKFYKTITRATHDIEYHFEQNPERALFQKGSKGWKALISVISILPLFTYLTEVFAPISGRGPLWILGITIVLLFIIPAIYLGAAFGQQSTAGMKTRVVNIAILILLSAVLGVTTVGMTGFPLMQFCAATFSTIFAAFMVTAVSKRTEYGDRILEKVLWFSRIHQNR